MAFNDLNDSSATFERHAWKKGQPLVVVAIVLAVPIIPFLLFGAQLESWTDRWLDRDTWSAHPGWASAAVLGLLVSDILLPIPSSGVCTFAGRILGIPMGTLVCWIGLNSSVLVGYGVGRLAGWPMASRLANRQELQRTGNELQRWGMWLVVLFRAMPVLAEASVIWAGLYQIRLARLWIPAFAANLGLAIAYVALGQWSSQSGWFSLALPLSLGIPVALLMSWLATRRLGSRSRKARMNA